MKCFYHSADLDGHCSGAIVNDANGGNVDMIGINYGDEFPWDSIENGETVYMVDFTLQPFEDMEKLNSLCDLIWIDHHKTAIDEAYKRGFLASGGQSLEVGKAACELVWDWFYKGEKNDAVHLLGRYDVWDLIPGTLELQNGLRMHDTRPDNYWLWGKLLNGSQAFLEEQLGVGEILLKKQKMDNEAYVRSCSFETEIDGLKCIAINRGLTNSQIFESVYDTAKYDVMLTFVWKKGRWTVSMYSDQENIDVGVICKSRGGGGHRGAAGFQCDELPFVLT